MVKDSGTTVRADRLRPLNTPRPVHVTTDERGRPTVVGLWDAVADTETGGRGEAGKEPVTASPSLRVSPSPRLRVTVSPPHRVSPSPRLRVIDILDQWRIDDEWWRRAVSRMYFHVTLEGGQLLTLFQDLTTGRWYGQTSATPR